MAGEERNFGRIWFLNIVLFQILSCVSCRELSVITVATKENDGYKRFLRSTENAGLSVTALGMGQQWQGGDMNYPGGGWKVNLLKQEMKKNQFFS